jgi:hypothetical protein
VLRLHRRHLMLVRVARRPLLHQVAQVAFVTMLLLMDR